MKDAKTEEYFEELFDRIDQCDFQENYRINNGGCGCFALAMAKKYPELKIVYLADNERGLKHSIDTNRYIATSHVMVKIGEAYFDTDGRHERCDLEEKYLEIEPVSEEFLEEALKNRIEWNDTFYRGDMNYIMNDVEEIEEDIKFMY